MTVINPFDSAPATVLVASLDLPEFRASGVEVDLLRLDLIHPLISGNKWFKLKYALSDILNSPCRRVLSFGGAWSNHLHALAYAGHQAGIETVGVIRGEQPERLSDTLQDATGWGMKLRFVSRQQYRDKSDPDFLAALAQEFGEFHLLPEGGTGDRVIDGCREIMALFDSGRYSLLCCACGTGGTLAGLIAAKPEHLKIMGVSALKGGDFLYHDIRRLLHGAGVSDPGGWQIELDSHEGGYARVSPRLAGAIDYFRQHTGIMLEPVYSGKAFLALCGALQKGTLKSGSRVLLVHTGGMQGLRGMELNLRQQLSRFKNEYNV